VGAVEAKALVGDSSIDLSRTFRRHVAGQAVYFDPRKVSTTKSICGTFHFHGLPTLPEVNILAHLWPCFYSTNVSNSVRIVRSFCMS